MKIQFGSVYKCERFFEYTAIDNNSKVKLAVIHLEDGAVQWYQWFERTNCLVNCATFKKEIIARFGPNV